MLGRSKGKITLDRSVGPVMNKGDMCNYILQMPETKKGDYVELEVGNIQNVEIFVFQFKKDVNAQQTAKRFLAAESSSGNTLAKIYQDFSKDNFKVTEVKKTGSKIVL